jgi:dihydroorotase-like cyclic amidohydrolase
VSNDPLDTRVTNGRFVGPDAPANGSLTIHNGRIVDAADSDVWRTVNASGHLVFPGLIQPSGVEIETALTAVRGGVTTAIAPDASNGPCLDVLCKTPESLKIIEPDACGALSDDEWEVVLNDDSAHVEPPAGINFPLIHFLYHEGHLKRSMSLDRIVAVTSGNIAHAAGIFPSKGSFAVGSDADLFVFDPDSQDQYSDFQWPGRVIFSLLRGKILLYNGQIHTTDGDGEIVG